MYIPKKSRFEMFLKRKSSTSSNSSSNNNGGSNNNWSEVCTDFIKDVVLRRRISTKSKNINGNGNNTLNDLNLCLDQLSEFQKSYVSFPEFSDSSISNESATDSEASAHQGGHYWVLSSSSSSSNL